MQAIYLTTDLFFSSRIVSLARQQGWDMHLVGNSAAVLQRATSAAPLQLLLIDLQHSNVNLAELISTLRPQHPQLRVIAYGPHVDEALLENARQAGCDQVLSRGQFNQQASSLLQPI
jgi:CheY-like chemotaxis protein